MSDEAQKSDELISIYGAIHRRFPDWTKEQIERGLALLIKYDEAIKETAKVKKGLSSVLEAIGDELKEIAKKV